LDSKPKAIRPALAWVVGSVRKIGQQMAYDKTVSRHASHREGQKVTQAEFGIAFQQLTVNQPVVWQERLFDHFMNNWV